MVNRHTNEAVTEPPGQRSIETAASRFWYEKSHIVYSNPEDKKQRTFIEYQKSLAKFNQFLIELNEIE